MLVRYRDRRVVSPEKMGELVFTYMHADLRHEINGDITIPSQERWYLSLLFTCMSLYVSVAIFYLIPTNDIPCPYVSLLPAE